MPGEDPEVAAALAAVWLSVTACFGSVFAASAPSLALMSLTDVPFLTLPSACRPSGVEPFASLLSSPALLSASFLESSAFDASSDSLRPGVLPFGSSAFFGSDVVASLVGFVSVYGLGSSAGTSV